MIDVINLNKDDQYFCCQGNDNIKAIRINDFVIVICRNCANEIAFKF